MTTSGRRRRNGITRQAMNSRWSVPSRMCEKPRLDEAQRRLVPARVEMHEARVAVELVGALRRRRAAGSAASSTTCRPRRARRGSIENPRPVGGDRQLEQQVERCCLPVQLGLRRNRRLPARCAIASSRRERAVGRQRHARRRQRRPRQAPVVLEQARGCRRTIARRLRAAPRRREPGRGSPGRAAACRPRSSRRAAPRSRRTCCWPSGLTKAWMRTSAGMSWAKQAAMRASRAASARAPAPAVSLLRFACRPRHRTPAKIHRASGKPR